MWLAKEPSVNAEGKPQDFDEVTSALQHAAGPRRGPAESCDTNF